LLVTSPRPSPAGEGDGITGGNLFRSWKMGAPKGGLILAGGVFLVRRASEGRFEVGRIKVSAFVNVGRSRGLCRLGAWGEFCGPNPNFFLF
jgi:hypothetical protein